MNGDVSSPNGESTKRSYSPRLPTKPLIPKSQDSRYPRRGLSRWVRSLSRFWLLPLQVYAAALLASLAVWAVVSLVPTTWPGVLADAGATLDAIATTGQIVLLAPLAALIEHYPLALLLLLLLILLFWSLDSWGLVDRRRERSALEQETRLASQVMVPLRLHGDVPFLEDAKDIENDKFDPLEYHKFVDVMTRLVVNSAESSPLVISLEAKWGMGKTTAMRMIQRRLINTKFNRAGRNWKCFTVYFNAWKYDAGADVRNGLMSAVFEAIPRRAIRWHLRESRGALLGLLLSGVSLILPSGDATMQLVKRLDHEARYRNEFEHDLRRILAHWARIEGETPLLVVFVDDLDRCLSYDAVRTLETIKLFFDIPGCVFVLGFDPDKLAAYIQQQHPETNGAEYLKKLVQLSYRLPKPVDVALEAFTKQAITDMGLANFFEPDMFERLPGGFMTFIRRGTGGNPREITRFLNATAVSAEVMHPQLQFDTNRIGLSLLMMLQIRWPDFYQKVTDRLAASTADIEKIIDASPDMSEENRDSLRATALDDVLSELYEAWGLFPDTDETDTTAPTSGDEPRDDTGGVPPYERAR